MGFRNPITSAEDPTARTEAEQAQQTADQALTLATGKNATYLAPTEPAPPAAGFTTGDTWLDTTDRVLNVWENGAWTPQQWGSQALAAGAVIAGTVAAGAIDGMTITGSTIQTASSGQRATLHQKTGISGATTTTAGSLDFTNPDGTSGGSVTSTTIGSTGGAAQGGSLAIGGGSWNGVAAPQLASNVEEAPAGGYQAVARVSGAAVAYTSVPWQNPTGPRSWAGQSPDVFRNVPWAVSSSAGFGAEMYVDAAGICHLEALLAYTGAGGYAAGSGSIMASLPADLLPRHDLWIPAEANNSLCFVQILTNGQLIYMGGPTLGAGSTVGIYTSYLSTQL